MSCCVHAFLVREVFCLMIDPQLFLLDGRTVSLRDVYYALKGLFRNQKECNAIILEVGRVLKLKRRKNHDFIILHFELTLSFYLLQINDFFLYRRDEHCPRVER